MVIPENRSYVTLISQLVRFFSINCLFEGFIDDFGNLVKKLCTQGFKLAALHGVYQIVS